MFQPAYILFEHTYRYLYTVSICRVNTGFIHWSYCLFYWYCFKDASCTCWTWILHQPGYPKRITRTTALSQASLPILNLFLPLAFLLSWCCCMATTSHGLDDTKMKYPWMGKTISQGKEWMMILFGYGCTRSISSVLSVQATLDIVKVWWINVKGLLDYCWSRMRCHS